MNLLFTTKKKTKKMYFVTKLYDNDIWFQIFLKFKSPFWSKKENNNALPILFGKYDGTKKLGATGISDKHLRTVTLFKVLFIRPYEF